MATVIDLAPRRLLGWSMGHRHDATLVGDALHAAVAARARDTMEGTIFHHDRGAETRFKRSSQHPDRRGCDGKDRGVGAGADGTSAVVLAGATNGVAVGACAGVLAGDRRDLPSARGGLVSSRTGSCLDNAVAESLFATLKAELVNRTWFTTRAGARHAIFRWIAYYKHHRLHYDRLPALALGLRSVTVLAVVDLLPAGDPRGKVAAA